jgi:Kef-type K+ transport system membrane component KefB
MLYGVLTLTIGRKLLSHLAAIAERENKIGPALLGFTMMLLFLCSWITDAIGIHSVFGGFILGVAMPRGFFSKEIRRQIEPVVVVCFLPLFFTFSGLNTRLDTMNSPQLLVIAVIVLWLRSWARELHVG